MARICETNVSFHRDALKYVKKCRYVLDYPKVVLAADRWLVLWEIREEVVAVGGSTFTTIEFFLSLSEPVLSL